MQAAKEGLHMAQATSSDHRFQMETVDGRQHKLNGQRKSVGAAEPCTA